MVVLWLAVATGSEAALDRDPARLRAATDCKSIAFSYFTCLINGNVNTNNEYVSMSKCEAEIHTATIGVISCTETACGVHHGNARKGRSVNKRHIPSLTQIEGRRVSVLDSLERIQTNRWTAK
eukprot:CAMPEP_0197050220 /NCGR_PEP_ID=MMETSP1384-20130603/25161_1 /TAXON_ID=29189 /ORGANISM="Ammonia sp." /LENGTH=122 /DNA_ID=CAMNT_0042482593 /DNA_START=8 /DNA_END=376 /DNA_ORIENTATION=-